MGYWEVINCEGLRDKINIPKLENDMSIGPIQMDLNPDHDVTIKKADVIKMTGAVERYVQHLRANPPTPVTQYTSETHSQEELWALVNGCRRGIRGTEGGNGA